MTHNSTIKPKRADGSILFDLKTANGFQQMWTRLLKFYTHRERIEWLVSPHPQLDGKSPFYFVVRNDVQRLDEILDRLETGIYL